MDEVIKLYFSINKTNVNVLFDANNEFTVNSTATSLTFITSFTAFGKAGNTFSTFIFGERRTGKAQHLGTSAVCSACSVFAVLLWTKSNRSLERAELQIQPIEPSAAAHR